MSSLRSRTSAVTRTRSQAIRFTHAMVSAKCAASPVPARTRPWRRADRDPRSVRVGSWGRQQQRCDRRDRHRLLYSHRGHRQPSAAWLRLHSDKASRTMATAVTRMRPTRAIGSPQRRTARNNGKFTGCADLPNSSWHGTRVSGIIGALSNNSLGVTGITWNPWILPARALGKCGGFDSDIIDAMAWAAGLHFAKYPTIRPQTGQDRESEPRFHRAVSRQVINRSCRRSLPGACWSSRRPATKNGPVDTPANCPGVVAVAGLRHAGTKVGFAVLDPKSTVGAPGGNCVTRDRRALLVLDRHDHNDGTTTAGNYTYTDQIQHQRRNEFLCADRIRHLGLDGICEQPSDAGATRCAPEKRCDAVPGVERPECASDVPHHEYE